MNVISINTYHQVAKMNSSINYFIQQANIIKSKMSSALLYSMNTPSFSTFTGIGNKVDIYA